MSESIFFRLLAREHKGAGLSEVVETTSRSRRSTSDGAIPRGGTESFFLFSSSIRSTSATMRSCADVGRTIGSWHTNGIRPTVHTAPIRD
jgi:hypothetical protein